MSKNKLAQKHFKLVGVIPLLLFNLGIYPLGVQAQPTRSLGNTMVNAPTLIAQKFPDNGEPTGRRRGGTSRREGCPELKTPITALVPGEDAGNKSFLAATISDHPTFWVYIPELPPNLSYGEFVLQDEQSNDIWRTPLALPRKAGAIAISLPPNPQYVIEQGAKYHWFFKVYCRQPENQPEYFYVDAWVQRVALTPDLEQQLKTAKSRQYATYAANNLWYDAVTNLAELRRSNWGDRALAESWSKLLASLGLTGLAAAPIVQHYPQDR